MATLAIVTQGHKKHVCDVKSSFLFSDEFEDIAEHCKNIIVTPKPLHEADVVRFSHLHTVVRFAT